jgi:hypothetical protein
VTKQTSIRVSHSRSGLNLYLPAEAVASVPATRYAVELSSFSEEGDFLIKLYPYEGKNRFSSHADPERQHRLTVRELRKTGLSLRSIDEFGIIDVKWSILTNTPGTGGPALSAILPASKDWPAPRRPRPRTRVGDRQLKLKLGGKAQQETPHQRLGRVLRELNELLSSGAVDDVAFRLVGNTDVNDYPAGVVAGIKGRLVKEETFG